MVRQRRAEKINIVKLAYLYVRDGQWDKAIEEYRKLLDADPADMNVRKMLGDVYVKKNAGALAYEEYCKVEAHFISQGKTAEVDRIHEKIAALDKKQLSPEARKKQALLQAKKKTDEAIEANKLEEVAEVHPELSPLVSDQGGGDLTKPQGGMDSAAQNIQLGESFLKGHLFKKAIEAFKKAAELEPDNRETHLQLAQVYERCGQGNDAKKEYLTAASLALAAGDMDVAFGHATKAVELKSIEAQFILGAVFFHRQEWAEAKSKLESLLRIKSNHVEALVCLGRVYGELGQTVKATELFQKAIVADKEGFAALEAWADHCARNNNKEEAVKALSLLIDRVEAAGHLKRAVDLARTLIVFDVNQLSSKLRLAQLLERTKDKVAAADVYYHLAMMNENQNKHEEAAQYLKKTEELNPEHPRIVKIVAEEQPEEKATSETIHLTYDILNDVPVTAVREEEQKVEESVTPLAEVSPREAFESQIKIAEQYSQQGLLSEAITVYQQLLEIAPDNSLIVHKLNQVYTSYAKTGTDLTKIFEMPAVREEIQKVDLDTAKRILKEIEVKNRSVADKRIRTLLERTARAEAENIHLVELKKTFRELEAKAQAEADRKIISALERSANEETPKSDETIFFLTTEKDKKRSRPTLLSQVEKSQPIVKWEEIVALAEGDVLFKKGLFDEAAKLYQRVLQNNPGHEGVQKKLEQLGEVLNSRGYSSRSNSAPKSSDSSVMDPTVTSPHSESERKKIAKAKTSKIGFV